MVAAVFNGFKENFDDNSEQQSGRIAITDTLTLLQNQILQFSSNAIEAGKILAEAGSELYIEAGRHFNFVKINQKRNFKKQLVAAEINPAQANKFIKAAAIADELHPTVGSVIGVDILTRLAQPRNEKAMSALVNLGEGTTQASAIETIKELKIPVPPKPPEPPLSWKKNRDGDRTIVLRMPDSDPALQFESGYKQSGLPLQMYVSELLQKAEHGRITSDVEKFQVLAEETQEYKAKLGLFEAEAKKYEAEARELREIEAENKQLEKEAQQVEAIACNLVEQFPSTLFFKSLITQINPTPAVEVLLLDTDLPNTATEQPTIYEVATAELHEYLEAQSQSIAPEPQQEVSTHFSSPTPPTERYMLGWNLCDQVIANSVVPTFEQWCLGKPVLIESVQGNVGSVQQLTVVRCDGESRMSFGNWVEEIKSENTTPKGAAVASVEVDHELLSDALKKAASWQEVERLVERDSSRLTFAVKEWTPVQKNSLRDLLTSYLKSDADALIWHLVDWMPLTSLEKSFKQLFFKVRNIMEGLTAPWLNGFEFVHVDDFGLDTEEWTFIDPASSQNIKVYDRKDFAVQAF